MRCQPFRKLRLEPFQGICLQTPLFVGFVTGFAKASDRILHSERRWKTALENRPAMGKLLKKVVFPPRRSLSTRPRSLFWGSEFPDPAVEPLESSARAVLGALEKGVVGVVHRQAICYFREVKP